MPDLGRYATEVALAYGLSLWLMVALVLWVWARGRRLARELEALESRIGGKANGAD